MFSYTLGVWVLSWVTVFAVVSKTRLVKKILKNHERSNALARQM